MKILIALLLLLSASVTPAQTEQQKRVTEIQTALQKANLGGWLFYDFRGSDILIPRILKTERLG